MAIHGSCLCGAVRFEIDKASGPFEICHCNRCRKVSGAAGFPTIGVLAGDYRMTAGQTYPHRIHSALEHNYRRPAAIRFCGCGA